MSGQGIVPQAISVDSGDVQPSGLIGKPEKLFQSVEIEQANEDGQQEAQNFAVPEAYAQAPPVGQSSASASEGAA